MVNKHDYMVDSIRRSPHRIGIEEQVASTGEVIFWKGQNYVTSPDSLIFTQDKKVIVIEYKSTDRNKPQDLKQLQRHMFYTEKLFDNFEVHGFYVHGVNERKLNVKKI